MVAVHQHVEGIFEMVSWQYCHGHFRFCQIWMFFKYQNYKSCNIETTQDLVD